MNIKQSIFALLITFGVSFSASAAYQISVGSSYYDGIYDTYEDMRLLVAGQCAPLPYPYNFAYYGKVTTSSVAAGSLTFKVSAVYKNSSCTTYQNSSGTYSIPFTTVEDCEFGYVRNELGQCVLDDEWCSGSEFLGLQAEATLACFDAYPDWHVSLVPSCTDSNNYSFECVQIFPKPSDPTDDIDAPDSDFTGGSGGTANPAPPSFDKPEPDDVAPEDTTDTAVLTAIQNMNRDNNQAFTGLNTDVNEGFADVNNQLSQLNDTNNAIGQSIVDQMNQDYQIYQGQKALMRQQTEYIASGSASIVSSIDGQTSQLKASLLGLGSGIGTGLDGLGSKIDGLGEKLGEIGAPCDPNEDARNCEGEHGLTHDTAKDVTNQIDAAVSGQFDEAESAILDSTNQFTDGSFVSSVQVYLDDTVNLALGAMPNIGDCTPFSMPSPFGGTIDFGCEFSVKFKSIASFLLYVYTIWTLLDILFEGVTPVPGTVPHRSRGI